MASRDVSIIRPQPNDSDIGIPVTFDYRGGRRESAKSKKWLAIIAGVVTIFIVIALYTKKDWPIAVNLIAGTAVFLVAAYIIRRVILKENIYRKEYSYLMDRDYVTPYRAIWGIFDIEDQYPYIVHFRNGKIGIFVRLEKDVVVGKEVNEEYYHYEAISDAYNIAGQSAVDIVHIDYMDNIGSDARMSQVFMELNNCDNPDIREALTDMYNYLQYQMDNKVSTFDIYLFTCRSTPRTLEYNVKQILRSFMDANYNSFTILNSDSIKDIARALFNLMDFSAIKASEEVFASSTAFGIRPIRVYKTTGEVIELNKTYEQEREERRQKENERVELDRAKRDRKEKNKQELLRQQAAKKKGNGKKEHDDEEIDFF